MAEPAETMDERAASSAPSRQRWKCVCAYDGAAFAGWQSQVGGTAVQDVIERRLAAIFGTLVRVHASGRTDAGVHARGQVFHFDAAWRHGPEKLAAALRSELSRSVQIRSVRAVPSSFHARFGATGKTYVYHLHVGDPDPFTRPYVWALQRAPDLGAMRAAARALEGRHDFAAFSAFNGTERETTVRTLRRLQIVARGKRIRITADADGFLYKMVRSLVGALVAAGEGKLGVETIVRLLAEGRRTAVVQTAPPQGLFLEKVAYGRRAASGDPHTESRVRRRTRETRE